MNIRTALQDPEAFTCLDVQAVLWFPVAPLGRGPFPLRPPPPSRGFTTGIKTRLCSFCPLESPPQVSGVHH